MTRPLNAFQGDLEYVCLTYDKGVLLFDALRETLGKERFLAALAKFYKKYSGKIASPQNLKDCFKKGAAAILAECGSLTAFYDNPGLVSSEKNRQRLLDGRELVEKNRRLIKLRGALPEHYSKIERWLRRNPDWNGIRREFEELEFGSLLKELPPPEPELSQGLFNF